jgi:hypothetical protein
MLIPPFSEALKYGKQLELRGWRLGSLGRSGSPKIRSSRARR